MAETRQGMIAVEMVDVKASKHYDTIRTSRLGELIGDELSIRIAGAGQLESWRGNSIVFWEGDSPKGIYIVLNGAVKLVRQRDDGRELLLHVAQESDMIAEAALFLERNPVTAITTMATELFLLPKDDVLRLLEESNRFTRHMFNVMSQWLDRHITKIDQLTLDSATSRIISYLLDLRKRQESDEVRLPIKKGDLAAMLNMRQATLSRVLRRLQDEGVLSIEGRVCILQNIPALEALTMPSLDGF